MNWSSSHKKGWCLLGHFCPDGFLIWKKKQLKILSGRKLSDQASVIERVSRVQAAFWDQEAIIAVKETGGVWPTPQDCTSIHSNKKHTSLIEIKAPVWINSIPDFIKVIWPTLAACPSKRKSYQEKEDVIQCVILAPIFFLHHVWNLIFKVLSILDTKQMSENWKKANITERTFNYLSHSTGT